MDAASLHLLPQGRRHPRLFRAPPGAVRSRRATDAALAASAAMLLLLAWSTADPVSGGEKAIGTFAAALTSFFAIVLRSIAVALLLWALIIVLAALRARQYELLRDLAVSGAAAAALAAAVGFEIGRNASPARAALPIASWELALLAGSIAMASAASRYLVRAARTTGRVLIALAVPSVVLLGWTAPAGAPIALACGLLVAGLVRLAVGAPSGTPSVASVQTLLDEIASGVRVQGISPAQRPGGLSFDAQSDDGPVEVRVFGRDAWDAQLLARAWRAAWYREPATLTFTRSQQAEHEAFLTLMAERGGVNVHPVVAVTATATGDALLVLRRRGTPLTATALGADPELADRIWSAVDRIGAAGMAHGDLSVACLAVDGDDVVVGRMGAAQLTADPAARDADLAQTLTLIATAVGPEAAVASYVRRFGSQRTAEVASFVQGAALNGDLRGEASAAALDIDGLRTSLVTTAGIAPPTLARLRRITRRSAIQSTILVAAAYFLISAFAGIDFSALADALTHASWPILLLALVAGQLPRFAQAQASRSACPRPVRFGPVATLQFAISFISLAIPTSAARVAVNVRFFQRQGISAVSALSVGVIDSVGQFTVQIGILVVTLLLGVGEVDLSARPEANINAGRIALLLGIVVALAVIAALVVLAVPRWRHVIVERVRSAIGDVISTIRGVATPGRIAWILGGNLAAEVGYAVTLAIVLVAFGQVRSLATLLVINVAVSLFNGLMPVPGGIGVVEGALVLGLGAAGIEPATAFAIAICYRLCVYYLPPLWGAIAYRRLLAAGYL